MTDTILIALITFASGAIGAAVGAWGVIKSSERAAKGQMQQVIVQEFFKKRVEAYQTVLEAQIEMGIDGYSPDSVSKFLKAANSACVVASPQTAFYLMELREAERCRNMQQCSKVLSALLDSMQKDLTIFDSPEIHANFRAVQETTQAASKESSKPKGV